MPPAHAAQPVEPVGLGHQLLDVAIHETPRMLLPENLERQLLAGVRRRAVMGGRVVVEHDVARLLADLLHVEHGQRPPPQLGGSAHRRRALPGALALRSLRLGLGGTFGHGELLSQRG